VLTSNAISTFTVRLLSPGSDSPVCQMSKRGAAVLCLATRYRGSKVKRRALCETPVMPKNAREGYRNNVPAARDLRARETWAEALLWDVLRDRRLDGLKFRRQHPVGPFVVDFCCAERRLVVELDGGVHEEQKERDDEREQLLLLAGYRVLRFSNDMVRNQLSDVVTAIRAAYEEPLPRPQGPGRRAGWS